MEIVPVTRKERFLKAAMDSEPLTIDAVTRIETYLSKISGADVTIPDPVTKIEMYLASIAGADVVLPDPVTRVEKYLAKLAGMDVLVPEPITRIEQFLSDWVNQPSGVLKTISGAVVFVSDALARSAEDISVEINPIQDLHGYSNPWPAGGGKNLWDEEWIVDGTAIASKNKIPCEAGQWYYINISPANGWRFYDSENNIIETVYTNYKQAPNGAVAMWFKLGSAYGTTYKNDVIVAKTTGAGIPVPYSPYANICPISGHTLVKVWRTGKNLLNRVNEDLPKTVSGVEFSRAGGDYIVNATSDKTGYPFAKIGELHGMKADTYTLSCDIPASGMTVRIIDREVTPAQTVASVSYSSPTNTFTVANNISDTLSIEIAVTGSTIAVGSYTIHPQLELGSTATAYEPYQGTSVEVALGQTVYGGTLDVTTGLLTVTHVLWEKNTSTMNNSDSYPGWDNAGVKALGFPQGTYNNLVGNIGNQCSINTNGTNDILFLSMNTYGLTQPEWIAMAVDVQFVLPLPTPQTVQLTPTEIEMLLGENTVWSENGDITLTYMADGNANDVEALNILLGNRYVNLGEPDEATDREALDILLGGR